jgi:uncharacterized repeat protein (TIGR03803 family)
MFNNKTICLFLTICLCSKVGAQNLTTLHSFSSNGSNGTNGDGSFPVDGLVLAGKTLYGTAMNGGSFGGGTLFAINTDGTGFTTLYSFQNSAGSGINFGGSLPHGELILSGNTLYGTTTAGGNSGYGTVFAINTDGTDFNVLVNFDYYSGYDSVSALILSGNTLYGEASGGGAGAGTVFAVNTDGTGFRDLYDFPFSNGDSGYALNGLSPNAALVLSGNTLYGTAQSGGSYGNHGNGTVFAINTNGSGFSVLHNFAGDPSDGSNPAAGLSLLGNTLYGTTEHGGLYNAGGVFAIGTDGGNYTNLFSFGNDGYPLAGLIVSDTTLYGTTYGTQTGEGVVFAINGDGTGYTNLFYVPGNPAGAVVLAGNTLYGTTEYGGNGYGTIFSLSQVTQPTQNADGAGDTPLLPPWGIAGLLAGLACLGIRFLPQPKLRA